MRTKKRQTNIQILNRALEELSVDTAPTISQNIQKVPQHEGWDRRLPPKCGASAQPVVKLIEKPKKGRGAPKAALINTSKLLTG